MYVVFFKRNGKTDWITVPSDSLNGARMQAPAGVVITGVVGVAG